MDEVNFANKSISRRKPILTILIRNIPPNFWGWAREENKKGKNLWKTETQLLLLEIIGWSNHLR